MKQETQARSFFRIRLRTSVIVAAFVIAYALAGFLLAPWIAGRELPRLVEEQLHLRARVGEIDFNPFTLRLGARDFALETAEGRPLLGFSDAVVVLQWRSLLRRAWVLDEVRLVDPAAHLEIAKDGRLNLAALAPDAAPARSGESARFAVGQFSVVNGSIDFEDHRQGYRNRVERLSIDLASLSTLEEEKGPYSLVGQTATGGTLRWKGELSLAPVAASGTLVIGNAALAELMPYVDDFTSSRIVAGRADLELPYRLSLTGGQLRLSLTGAKLDLRELALATPGEGILANLGPIALGGIDFDSDAQHASAKAARIGESTLVSGKDRKLLATLAQLALEDVTIDFAQHRASVKTLRLADPTLALERNASGELDLPRLVSGKSGGAADGAKPAEWRAEIGAVEIANGSARYTDRSAKTALAFALDGLSANFRVDAASGGEGVRVRLDAGKIALAKVEALAAGVQPGAAQPPAVRLANLTLAGAHYDSGANTFEAEALHLGSLAVNTELEGGRPSLLDLVPAAGKAKSGKPLAARLKVFELREGSVNLTDRASGIGLALERVAGKLTNYSSDQTKPLAFDLSANVTSGGRIALRGRAVPAAGTVDARIEASGVALAPVQTMLPRWANVKLISGDVSLSGTLRVGGKDAKLAYAGSAGIANLALDDPAGVRLIGWKVLATDSLKATLSPDRVDIDELRLSAPAGRFAIAKDGTSNLSRAFAKKDAAADAGAPPAAKPDAAPAPTEGSTKAGDDSAFFVAVRRVRVDQGALDFSDDSLSPGFVAKIFDLAGTANGLSTDHDTRSQFALEGRVDEFGYARLSGSVNPFAPRSRSNFRVQLRNIDLATASPYSMRFAGYRIATGRMTLDLNYRVQDSLIEGDNKITLDKFTLGERVESPDALKLPLELAIALLKDPDGTISLELPVKGSLDDPQFSLAPLIWKAVGNLLRNIITAPFRALAHLFGGAAEAEGGMIAFDPGGSRLLPPEREKLARVVEVLAKRPELKLEIPEQYDSEADARALKRTALARDIGRRAGFALADDEAPGPVNLDDKPTRTALMALFGERFGKGELDQQRAEAVAKAHADSAPAPSMADRVRNFVGGEPQVANTREFYQALLRRLREAQPLPADALPVLANRRALAMEAALTAAGADASRIARKVAQPAADAEARQIKVQLSLGVR